MAQETLSERADYPVPSVPYPDELQPISVLADHQVLFVKSPPKGGSSGEVGTFTDVFLGRSTHLNKEAERELKQLNATGFIEKMILALDRPRTSNIDKQVAFLTKTYLGTDPYRKLELMHT